MKKTLALLLALVMLFSLLPTAALAMGLNDGNGTVAETNTEGEQPKEEPTEEAKQEELAEAPMLLGAAPDGTPLTQANFEGGILTISESGTYYLNEDVTGNITVGEGVTVTLDLNGKVLMGDSSVSESVIKNQGNLTITDSSTGSSHYFKVDANGLWVLDDTLNTADYTFDAESGLKTVGGEASADIPAQDKVIRVSGGVITGGKTGSVVCIIGPNDRGYHGGGVFNDSTGTLTMTGGGIIGNTSKNSGGVFNLNVFSMSGGVVCGNMSEEWYGGCGGVENYGTFTMTGGRISGNKADNGGGVGNVLRDYKDPKNASNDFIQTGEFKMTGGSITGNTGNYGGGVYNFGKMTLEAPAVISGNTANYGGGVVNLLVFTMNSGIISGNTAEYGGGVYCNMNKHKVYGDGAFAMNGGTISGNTATECGGGVNYELVDPVSAAITGGSITGNKAKYGGGLYSMTWFKDTTYSISITGGSITGNTAEYGAGVCNTGPMVLGGNPNISGNNGESNFAIKTSMTGSIGIISIGTKTDTADGNGVAALKAEKPIGVTLLDADEKPTSGAFTKNGAKTDEAYFFSDNTAYADKYNNSNGGYLELVPGYVATEKSCENGSVSVGSAKSYYEGETVTVTPKADDGYAVSKVYYQSDGASAPTEIEAAAGAYTFTMPAKPVTVSATFETSHTHAWTYAEGGTGKENTITATCSADGHTGSATQTLTISAPALTTYSGSESEKAILSVTTLGGLTVSDSNVKYYAKLSSGGYDTTPISAPKTAGDYKAVLTVNDGTNDLTAYVTYTIAKATPTVTTAPTATAITYGQMLANSTLNNDGVTSVPGSFTWKDSTVKPTVSDSNFAQYDVVFAPTDSSNYNTVECKVTLTVNKATDNAITGTLTCADITEGGTPAPTGVTAKYGTVKYVYSVDGVVWTVWNKANGAGKYLVKTIVDACGDYDGVESNVASFTVKEKTGNATIKISTMSTKFAVTDTVIFTAEVTNRPCGSYVVWTTEGASNNFSGVSVCTDQVAVQFTAKGEVTVTAKLMSKDGQVLAADSQTVTVTKGPSLIIRMARAIGSFFSNLFR